LNSQFEILLPDASSTERLGFNIGKQVVGAMIVALNGPLGAGKTTFAQGAAKALGVEEVVNSPTFTMINEYRSGRIPLHHLDLYRLQENGGATQMAADEDLGVLEHELEELRAAPGLILVEWSDYFRSWMSQQDHIRVELNYSRSSDQEISDPDSTEEIGRTARVTASGAQSGAIVEALRNVYFS
jgi:tRNA threonylcarbamoyladenosine biosynthesis protein TsaE